MATLSVTIITKNEAANIRRCLESVRWVDEIIIVDSGSTDDTLAICREYTDKTFSTDWPGYGIQKNRALSHATKDWVLSLDADEEVSAELKIKIQEILGSLHPNPPVACPRQGSSSTREGTALSNPPSLAGEGRVGVAAYKIFRPVVFLNKIIKYATGASFDVRLFKRGCARFTDVSVHEKLVVTGSVGKLREPIYHYSFGTVAIILEKMNKYTTLVAAQRAERGQKGSIFKAITHAQWMFIKVYLLQRGFLDGKAGFILAVSFAEGAYYRYVKLYCLNQGY
ncbi:MAG: glycosyltransferase family 2 protein [Gammaproteobacteria bacterium]|nr:glycosyltransferase family 2 protein [Gammaproteobacteria bacterium]